MAANIAKHFVPISVGAICAFHEEKLKYIFLKFNNLHFLGLVVVTIFLMRLMDTNFQFAAVPALSVAIAAMALGSSLSEAGIKSCLSTRWITHIGKASYGVYLWQQLATYPFPGAGPFFYLCSIATCIIFALVLFEVFDKPMISIGRRLAARFRGMTQRKTTA